MTGRRARTGRGWDAKPPSTRAGSSRPRGGSDNGSDGSSDSFGEPAGGRSAVDDDDPGPPGWSEATPARPRRESLPWSNAPSTPLSFDADAGASRPAGRGSRRQSARDDDDFDPDIGLGDEGSAGGGNGRGSGGAGTGGRGVGRGGYSGGAGRSGYDSGDSGRGGYGGGRAGGGRGGYGGGGREGDEREGDEREGDGQGRRGRRGSGDQAEGAERGREAERDPRERAREIALNQLAVRPRTRAELAAALRKRGVEDEIVAEVLDRYDEVGLIDDAAFAKAWVASRHHGKGLAGRALAQELRRKGVDQEVAAEAVSELDSETEAQTAFDLAMRKLRTTRGEPDAVFRRLVGMLARKGYSGGVAVRAVKDALAARSAEDAELAEQIDPDSYDLVTDHEFLTGPT